MGNFSEQLWGDLRERGHRTRTLPHVRLPELVGGVGAAEAHALFARYCSARPDATDGPTRWARTLL